MDILMPEMGGYEASGIIRSMKRKDAGTVPIFAMTANAFAEDVEMSRKAGNERTYQQTGFRCQSV